MKKYLTCVPFFPVLLLYLTCMGSVGATVTLEVLNPRGEINPPPVHGINPRVADLNGKRVALIDNTKAGARTFLDVVQKKLQERYPEAIFLTPPKPEGTVLSDAKDWYPEVVKQFDTFIFGVAD